MTIKASQFTPQVLLSAPRRSAGVPNANGSHVLFTVNSYSFESHSKTNELRVLSTKTNESTLLLEQAVDGLNWLNEDAFVWLRGKEGGETEVCVGSVSEALKANARDDSDGKKAWYSIAGCVAAPTSNLKVKRLEAGDEYAVVLSAQANAKGELFNPEKAENTHSTGRLYTGLYVRHWDAYEEREKNTLWYGKLSKSDDDHGRFQLSPLTNALKGTKNLECPMKPFGGADNFDLSPRGAIAFVSKDPDLNPALNTKCNLYLLNVNSWTQGPVAGPKRVNVKGFEGASTAPIFSLDGSQVAFLSMKRNGYESDQNRIFVVGDLEAHELEASCEHDLVASQAGWDRSPSSIAWSCNGKAMLVTAEDEGHSKIFEIRSGQQTPQPLTKKGSVGDVVPLKRPGEIFYSGSSLIDNSTFAIIKHEMTAEESPLSVWTNSNSNHGNKFGLKEQQVTSIWTPASNPKVNEKVHSWVIKPSSFNSSKKYPVAYLIHGGPQGAWGDSWSTRWNPAVFAEQGFIVITPNITGSTGYGQAFTDAINRNWGGDPLVDIENVFGWVGKNLPEADNDRAVALGASYGGYMMNWIQGHPLGRKFKALVCHDGIFSCANMLSTEELYFPLYDLGGTPWDHTHYSRPGDEQPSETPNPSDPQGQQQPHHPFPQSTTSAWRRWDPAEHLSHWATPQLVIHNSKDYRICISEGLAAFNVLQARGVESQFLTFPDENHFVLKPENSLVWHKTVLNWIRKFVGMEPFVREDVHGVEFMGGVKGGE